MKRSLLFLIILLVCSSFAFANPNNPIVIVNSKDWRDMYLGAVYAGKTDRNFQYFESLADAQLKTNAIPKKVDFLIFESKNPVIKKYESYLKVNGFKNYETILYDDYTDLQLTLLEQNDYDGTILLDPRFGVEAVSAAPYALQNNYAPVFVDSENKEQVKSKISSFRKKLILGHFPIRLANDFSGEKIIGTTLSNTYEISRKVFSETKEEWGMIVKIDRVDFDAVRRGLPVVIYYGDLQRPAQIVRDGNINKFEIVGGDTLTVAQEIESAAAKDLRFILKYAKAITNLPEYKGRLFDVDTVAFPWPSPNIALEKVMFYPALDTLTLTLKNVGNVETLFFSTTEYSGISLVDDNIHSILPGDTLTLPYKVDSFDGFTEDDEATLNIRFGEGIPLSEAIESEGGSPIITREVSKSQHEESPSIQFIKAEYDDATGELSLFVDNPQNDPLKVIGEFIVNPDESVITSSIQTIDSGQGVISILTPYLRAKDFVEETYTFNFYFGEEDILFRESVDAPLDIKSAFFGSLILGNVVEIGTGGVLIPLILLIVVAIVVMILRARKRRKK